MNDGLIMRNLWRLGSRVGLSICLAATAVSCGVNSPNESSAAPTTPPIVPGPPVGPSGPNSLTVVVVAVDSMMPDDLMMMPNLRELANAGTTYLNSRSVFSAETIPNHVAMMTGVYPDRNGIPTNNFWNKEDGGDAAGQDLNEPDELEARTLFTHIARKCRGEGGTAQANNNPGIRTGAVMSKKYLHEIFQAGTNSNLSPALANVQPDVHWDPTQSPAYIGPGSEHTPDNATGPEARSTLGNVDFLFVNLGDLDRSSHASGAAGRSATQQTSDAQVGDIINDLKGSGRWENTLFILVSDHGMDFSDPTSSPPSGDAFFQNSNGVVSGAALLANSISTQPLLDALALPACGFDQMTAVQNGGTNSINVTAATPAQEHRSLLAARACLLNLDGSAPGTIPACADVVSAACKLQVDLNYPTNGDSIIHAWYTDPALYGPGNTLASADADLNMDTDGMTPNSIRSRHINLGQLVLISAEGKKFSEPDPSGNPIPGNHGHLATINNMTIIGGGAYFVDKSGNVVNDGTSDPFDRDPNQSENIDIAATVAWALGLDLQAGDFNGTAPNFGAPQYGTPREAGYLNLFDGRVLAEAFTIPVSTPPTQCGLGLP